MTLDQFLAEFKRDAEADIGEGDLTPADMAHLRDLFGELIQRRGAVS